MKKILIALLLVFCFSHPVDAYRTVSTNTLVVATDDSIYVNCSNGNVTLTLPDVTTISNGQTFSFIKTDTTNNYMIIVPSGSQTIEGGTSITINSGVPYQLEGIPNPGYWKNPKSAYYIPPNLQAPSGVDPTANCPLGQVRVGTSCIFYSPVVAQDTGTANNYVITLSQVPPVGFMYYFKAANTNTGASTITINGSQYPITMPDGVTPITAGYIQAGQLIQMLKQ